MTAAIDSGATDVPLLNDTIPQNLARTAGLYAEREALVSRHQSIRWTYREFHQRVRRLACGLLSIGLEKGDRVGIWSPNYAEWTLLQYATAEFGAILVNINPAYRAHELAYVLNQAGCRMLFAAPSFKTSDYVKMVDEVRDECPGLERAIFFWTPQWEGLWEQETADASAALARQRDALDADDPINIQYTSGTTGFPKGATLTHRNILNNGFFTTEQQGFSAEDRLCIPVPFYHCFGMVMGNLGCTSHGATMVIPGDAFDPQAVLETVEAERCTSLYGVPTMFIAALSHPEFQNFDLSSLRTGVMAGSPCPVSVMNDCVEKMHMRDVTICYGMTETSPVSTQTLPGDSLERRTSTVGRAHPHVEIRIADAETGETLERGQIGEMCTRGYSVMSGYWNDAERTAEAIDGDGWMHTGDLAVMDADGYANIVGRKKDMVIRGGENVYPREVEEYLHTHTAIADVQVVGVPDERFGEELLAAVKLVEGESLDEAAVRDYCRDRIAHYKIPRYVQFVTEYPMTVTGKVQKFKIREQAIADLGLQVADQSRTA